VSDELHKKNPDAPSYPPALMLILDISTCWSSTHQMMHKSLFFLSDLISSNLLPIIIGYALQYEAKINIFVMLQAN
jgi:hypothetical protein